MAKLKVKKISQLNTLVIEQDTENSFFTSTTKAVVIRVDTLAHILNFLIMNNYISPKVLEGVLSDYNTDRGKK